LRILPEIHSHRRLANRPVPAAKIVVVRRIRAALRRLIDAAATKGISPVFEV
jgi:hypothetical protein